MFIDVQYQQGELVMGAQDKSQTSGRTFINKAEVQIPCEVKSQNKMLAAKTYFLNF